jgi:hypothetical protein
MRRSTCALALLAVLSLPSHAESPHPQWNIRVLRMEGAAVSMRQAAESLQSISMDIVSSGRAQQAARLRSAADTLHRQVVFAGLAAGVLEEGIEPIERD